jgi:hypothetical protein
MDRPRLTIAGLMAVVLFVAAVFAAIRTSPSFLAPVIAIAAEWVLFARGGLRARAGLMLVLVVGTVIVPLVPAALISKGLWGYYFERPGLDRRIVEAIEVDFAVPVVLKLDDRGSLVFVTSKTGTMTEYIAWGRNDPYYCLDQRVLIALEDRGRLPTYPSPVPIRDLRLPSVFGLLEKTGLLEEGEPGYNDAKDLRGVVVQARGDDGVPLVFIGARGGQVSNDHYPYYEFLFAWPFGGEPRLLSSQQFYYDVAGIEGLEWPAFFLVFSTIGAVITLFLLAVVPAIREARRTGRRRG